MLVFRRRHAGWTDARLIQVVCETQGPSTGSRSPGQDLRYGVHQLGKAPVLVTVALLSLSFGIGANTALFTSIDTVMLQSLPVRDPGRLILFNDGISTGVYSGDDVSTNEFSYPFFNTFSRTPSNRVALLGSSYARTRALHAQALL